MNELDWDYLRLFIHVARTGRLSSAAERLNINHSTVARRMSAFEEVIGTRLFDRSPQGVTLTNEGAEMLVYAERIEQEAQMMMARIAGQEARLSGVVRVAVPEAFGVYLVTPMLADFKARHPGITIELIPDSRKLSLSRRDADLMVSTVQPSRGRMFISKLAEVGMGLYASNDYLAARGTPVSIDALAGHDFVAFVDDLLDTEDYMPLNQFVENPAIAFRSSSIISQQGAIAGGVGMGFLHDFAVPRTPDLVRVMADQIQAKRTFWLLVHADLRRIPRVRAVAGFLTRLARAVMP